MAKKKADKTKGEHFDPLGKAVIHTSRNEREECQGADRPEGGGRASKKTCDYSHKMKDLPEEYAKGHAQVHHLLCVGEVNGYHGLDNEGDIEDVYRPTLWCISNRGNLVRMPHKKYFLDVWVKDKSKKDVAPELPCHDLDHNLYNSEVCLAIESKIWDQVGVIQEDGKCFNEEDALDQFKGLSSTFRTKLKDRAQRGPGIPKVLKKMSPDESYTGGVPKSKQTRFKDLGPDWWEPFSMAQDATSFALYDLYPATKPNKATVQRRKAIKAFMKALGA